MSHVPLRFEIEGFKAIWLRLSAFSRGASTERNAFLRGIETP